MARSSDSNGSQQEFPHPKLSGFGARRALNYIQDIAKGRKDAVTFYRDPDGVIRELGTRKEIEVEPADGTTG